MSLGGTCPGFRRAGAGQMGCPGNTQNQLIHILLYLEKAILRKKCEQRCAHGACREMREGSA